MENKKLKYHYIYKDKNGGFFMTTERCESAEKHRCIFDITK